jgi:RNA polymerase sigma-32 factor
LVQTAAAGGQDGRVGAAVETRKLAWAGDLLILAHDARLVDTMGFGNNPFSAIEAKYASEINRYPLLTREEEQELARLYKKTGSVRAAETLVTSNLRFVVKVSYEYRSYGLKMSDLIQEGNLGLIKAVEKFDPSKDIRLISYAVWWIRAFIQNYILKNWSLVKLGTTQAQRKLFFSLARTKKELEKLKSDGEQREANVDDIAKRLKVRVSDVREMEQRMAGHDLSLDAPMDDDGGATHLDHVLADGTPVDSLLGAEQERARVMGQVRFALKGLDERERFIIENRLLTENPLSLKELGEHFGFSRERARQLELRARVKLRKALEAVAKECGLDTDAAVSADV